MKNIFLFLDLLWREASNGVKMAIYRPYSFFFRSVALLRTQKQATKVEKCPVSPGWFTTATSLFWVLPCTALWGQSISAPVGNRATQIVDRLLIKTGLPSPIHPEIKGFAIADIGAYTDSLHKKKETWNCTFRDLHDLQYLSDEFNEWSSNGKMRSKPLLRYFYRTPAFLFEINKKSENAGKKPVFLLRLNPMLNISLSSDRRDATGLLFLNQRGVELRAEIDRKLFIYSNVVESQARFPSYVNQWTEKFYTVPGAGSYKSYKSNLLDITKGRDFNVATAYIGVQATRHIGVQFGHGRQVIGNGYRSVFLSDFAPPAFFLKLNTRVWKFHYQNIFMELSPRTAVQNISADLLPKKYMAIHYLNLNLTPQLSLGLFEATAFNRSKQFEWQYLNPVILYRSVEAMIGSPDNVIIGLDGRWNFLKRFQLYSQLTIDEFILKELRDRNGWWGNKYAIQAGIKYIDAFGVDHLDLQVEANLARPYTWSHFDSLNSFSHFNHSLAHPLGANFKEIIALVRWNPLPHWGFTGKWIQMQTGDDPEGENYGGNILYSYFNRPEDYGNFIGQGIGARTFVLGFDASWEFWRNTFLDFRVLLREKKSSDLKLSLDNHLFTMGIRMNFSPVNHDF